MIFSKEEMAKKLQAESKDYIDSRPKEFNRGYLYSGVNKLVRGSANIKSSGTGKDPFKI